MRRTFRPDAESSPGRLGSRCGGCRCWSRAKRPVPARRGGGCSPLTCSRRSRGGVAGSARAASQPRLAGKCRGAVSLPEAGSAPVGGQGRLSRRTGALIVIAACQFWRTPRAQLPAGCGTAQARGGTIVREAGTWPSSPNREGSGPEAGCVRRDPYTTSCCPKQALRQPGRVTSPSVV